MSPVLTDSPDEAAGAGGGRGLFGGGRERTFVLFAQSVDVGVVVGGHGAARLGGGLSADWFQTGTVDRNEQRTFDSQSTGGSLKVRDEGWTCRDTVTWTWSGFPAGTCVGCTEP